MARILVVEDNPVNLELMLYLLQAFGHDATGVTDSASALHKALHEPYDLILADLLLPAMDGYTLASKLKAQPRPHAAPLIAVTAQAMVGDRKRALDAGFDGYIAKPIDPQRFLSQIEAFLPEPLRSRTTAPSVAARLPERTPNERGPLVLVVDDMQVNFDLVCTTLEPLGYRVADAQYPAQAAEMARSLSPALILCDVHMPGFDGFDVLEQISADPQLHAIPFIFLSSTSKSDRDVARGLSMGARLFLNRPIEPRELAAIVAEHVA
ncbi:MAG: response regulator [Candidatus Eremiobacteraeota bacterium]|nr:response regulator [Candidatus Eremiobacteraeota bacterium]MBV8365509.1 response regulator [Candidatus Eremiobacteraeota bacterium]